MPTASTIRFKIYLWSSLQLAMSFFVFYTNPIKYSTVIATITTKAEMMNP